MTARVWLASAQDYGQAAQAVRQVLPSPLPFHAGERVLVKPNLVMASPPQRQATTHPAVVEAVVRALQEAGCQVTLGDTPGGPFRQWEMEALYAATGMAEVARRTGARLMYDLTAVEVSVPQAKATHRLTVLRQAAQADAIVSVGKLKTHGLVGYTGVVKNLFGLIPGTHKMDLHARFRQVAPFCDALIDIERWARPRLSVLDGVYGMEGKGPTAGSPKLLGVVAAAADPYALDEAAGRLVMLDSPLIAAARRRGLVPAYTVCGGEIDALAQAFEPAVRRFSLKMVTHPVFSRLARSRPQAAPGCMGCGRCAACCPVHAITLEKGRPRFDIRACIRCTCCQELCPKGAIDLKQPGWLRLIDAIH